MSLELGCSKHPDKDIVHFTKEGKLVYYEGNFDAFRHMAAWLACGSGGSSCRVCEQLRAEGKDEAGCRGGQKCQGPSPEAKVSAKARQSKAKQNRLRRPLRLGARTASLGLLAQVLTVRGHEGKTQDDQEKRFSQQYCGRRAGKTHGSIAMPDHRPAEGKQLGVLPADGDEDGMRFPMPGRSEGMVHSSPVLLLDGRRMGVQSHSERLCKVLVSLQLVSNSWRKD